MLIRVALAPHSPLNALERVSSPLTELPGMRTRCWVKSLTRRAEASTLNTESASSGYPLGDLEGEAGGFVDNWLRSDQTATFLNRALFLLT